MSDRIRIILIGMRPLLMDAISLLFRVDDLIEIFGSVSEVDELPQDIRPRAGGSVLVFDGRQRSSELGGVIQWWKRRQPHSRTVAIDLEGTEDWMRL
jgi:hypothetical protein